MNLALADVQITDLTLQVVVAADRPESDGPLKPSLIPGDDGWSDLEASARQITDKLDYKGQSLSLVEVQQRQLSDDRVMYRFIWRRSQAN